MATYTLEDGGEGDVFSCPICFEDYALQDSRRLPKLLLCLHTFCYECTGKLWKANGSIECSMCRVLHEKVCLEDLIDNYVIIQHLLKAQEEQDLEFARKIDQQVNEHNESNACTIENSEEQNDQPDEFSETIDIVDSTDENIDEDETDTTAPEETSSREEDNMAEDPQVGIGMSDFQNILAELLESRFWSRSDTDDERSSDVGENDDNDVPDAQVAEEGADEDDSSSDSSNDDSGNLMFCLRNLLGGDDGDEHESEDNGDDADTNHLNENPSFLLENIHCHLGYADEDDDEEDERFHSACDDINIVWEGNDDLVHDGNEDDGDQSAYCWQLMNQETLIDD